MLTHIEYPIFEACKIRLNGHPERIKKFVSMFFSTPVGEVFGKNIDGGPGVAVFDSSRPLEGLQTFGFEGAEKLKALYSNLPQQAFHGKEAHENATTFDDGDLIIVQARKNLPHSGGSTALGRLRIALYRAALAEGLLEPDLYHHYLWVTNFPMFTLENGVDPGQEGTAGFSATHHPFTAPKTAEDVDLLRTDPLMAKADHYDLVVNGVELGGGSRRIHSAKMQRFVMQEVLKVPFPFPRDMSHFLLIVILMSFPDEPKTHRRFLPPPQSSQRRLSTARRPRNRFRSSHRRHAGHGQCQRCYSVPEIFKGRGHACEESQKNFSEGMEKIPSAENRFADRKLS